MDWAGLSPCSCPLPLPGPLSWGSVLQTGSPRQPPLKTGTPSIVHSLPANLAISTTAQSPPQNMRPPSLAYSPTPLLQEPPKLLQLQVPVLRLRVIKGPLLTCRTWSRATSPQTSMQAPLASSEEALPHSPVPGTPMGQAPSAQPTKVYYLTVLGLEDPEGDPLWSFSLSGYERTSEKEQLPKTVQWNFDQC